MGSRNRKSRSNIFRIITVCMMVICMISGTVLFDGTVYGSSFGRKAPFSHTGRTTYYHNSKFSNSLIVNGVDISDWQSKKCDFAKAKNAGVDFAIMKVTGTYYGRKKLSCYNDSNFSYQYRNARANGVMTGAYVFSQARDASEGKKEAQFAIKRLRALGIGPKDMQLPVYMDYEFAGGRFGRLYGLKRKNATAAAVAFCNTIKSAGYTPGIYANSSFFSSYIDTSVLAPDVDIWCAQYYSRCQSSKNYSKWQYTSSARINGLLHYLGYKWNVDADFWYVNKKVNSKPLTKIYGRTTLSLKDAKSPKFKIYNGKTLLEEGTDYVVGGIRNNRKGNAYAYIKGIGRYGGYALVPLKVTDRTVGSDKTALNSKSANYITKASAARSGSTTTAAKRTAAAPRVQKGRTYTTRVGLNIRKGPGTKYARVKRNSLPAATRKKTYSSRYSILKEGSRVVCLGVSGNWIRISGGWIAWKEGSRIHLK